MRFGSLLKCDGPRVFVGVFVSVFGESERFEVGESRGSSCLRFGCICCWFLIAPPLWGGFVLSCFSTGARRLWRRFTLGSRPALLRGGESQSTKWQSSKWQIRSCGLGSADFVRSVALGALSRLWREHASREVARMEEVGGGVGRERE